MRPACKVFMRSMAGLMLCSVLWFGLSAQGSDQHAPAVTAPPKHLKVPEFYTQYISADGYPIVASAKVNPYALHEAAYLVRLLLATRPDIREAMIHSVALQGVTSNVDGFCFGLTQDDVEHY